MEPETSDAPSVTTDDQDNPQVTLRVLGSDNIEIFFKIRRKTPLRKLTNAYCSRNGQDPAQVRFMFNGERLSGNETPDSLEMEDNDVIDAMVEQTGGARRWWIR
jgi:small ubiquitin-related modifier